MSALPLPEMSWNESPRADCKLPSWTARPRAICRDFSDPLAVSIATMGVCAELRPAHHQPPPMAATSATEAAISHGPNANLMRVRAGSPLDLPGVAAGVAGPKASSSSSSSAAWLRPFQWERSIAWNWRNPSGGSVPSIFTGTSRPLSRPTAASSRTQADVTDRADHSTMILSAAASATSISDEYCAPPLIRRSHHTDWPARSSSAAKARAFSTSSRT